MKKKYTIRINGTVTINDYTIQIYLADTEEKAVEEAKAAFISAMQGDYDYNQLEIDSVQVLGVQEIEPRWIVEPLTVQCSVCEEHSQKATRYCPHCGSEMLNWGIV